MSERNRTIHRSCIQTYNVSSFTECSVNNYDFLNAHILYLKHVWPACDRTYTSVIFKCFTSLSRLCVRRSRYRTQLSSLQRSHPALFSSPFGTHWCYCGSACSANTKRTARNNASSDAAIGNWIRRRRATFIHVLPILTSASDHACSSASAPNAEENKLVGGETTIAKWRNEIIRGRPSQNDDKLIDSAEGFLLCCCGCAEGRWRHRRRRQSLAKFTDGRHVTWSRDQESGRFTNDVKRRGKYWAFSGFIAWRV